MRPSVGAFPAAKLIVNLLGHLPAFDLGESEVGDRDFERELGHPDDVLGLSGVGSVFNKDSGI